ncbi:hypothetical protein D3C71_1340170 [compost metagenome]
MACEQGEQHGRAQDKQRRIQENAGVAVAVDHPADLARDDNGKQGAGENDQAGVARAEAEEMD